MALREKHKLFISLYTAQGKPTFLNATKSAKESNYGLKNCASAGSQLLKRPDIKREVERILEERRTELAVKAGITKDELVAITAQSLEEVPASHPNRPRYIDLLAVMKGYKGDGTTNNLLIFNEGENRHLNEKESTLKSRLSNLVRKSKTAVKRADTEIVDIPSTNERDA